MEKPVSNSASALMIRKTITLFALFFLISLSLTAQDLPLGDSQKYVIGDISVSGVTTYSENTVIAFTGLKKGDEIYLPGQKSSDIINKLWNTKLFSDVNLYITNIEGNVADIEIEVVEVPVLHEVKFTGIKKVKRGAHR